MILFSVQRKYKQVTNTEEKMAIQMFSKNKKTDGTESGPGIVREKRGKIIKGRG